LPNLLPLSFGGGSLIFYGDSMPEHTEHRLPPQNLEAEMSVLGGILLENEALHRALETLRPDDFYRDAHRKIFE